MPEGTLERLCADGLLRRDGGSYRTTPKWQAAMARAALGMMQAGDDGRDLRVPIAAALYELYPELGDDELADRIESVLPIEARELAPPVGALADAGPGATSRRRRSP